MSVWIRIRIRILQFTSMRIRALAFHHTGIKNFTYCIFFFFRSSIFITFYLIEVGVPVNFFKFQIIPYNLCTKNLFEKLGIRNREGKAFLFLSDVKIRFRIRIFYAYPDPYCPCGSGFERAKSMRTGSGTLHQCINVSVFSNC